MTTRTRADEPYIYNGQYLTETEQAATIRKAEDEAIWKTTAELFRLAESEYYMATRHYPRSDGRERQADRAMLRAATFDRLAREAAPTTCINCGDETDGGTVCSAGCGYAVTGEYPDLYEKDYGDDE